MDGSLIGTKSQGRLESPDRFFEESALPHERSLETCVTPRNSKLSGCYQGDYPQSKQAAIRADRQLDRSDRQARTRPSANSSARLSSCSIWLASYGTVSVRAAVRVSRTSEVSSLNQVLRPCDPQSSFASMQHQATCNYGSDQAFASCSTSMARKGLPLCRCMQHVCCAHGVRIPTLAPTPSSACANSPAAARPRNGNLT